MASFEMLKQELQTDPLGSGYAAMADQQVVDSLEVVDRPSKAMWPATKVLNAIVKTEFIALSNVNKQLVWDILHIGDINPYGIEASLFLDAFGGSSATITALVALRNAERISRGQELGLGEVSEFYVWEARNK